MNIGRILDIPIDAPLNVIYDPNRNPVLAARPAIRNAAKLMGQGVCARGAKSEGPDQENLLSGDCYQGERFQKEALKKAEAIEKLLTEITNKELEKVQKEVEQTSAKVAKIEADVDAQKKSEKDADEFDAIIRGSRAMMNIPETPYSPLSYR